MQDSTILTANDGTPVPDNTVIINERIRFSEEEYCKLNFVYMAEEEVLSAKFEEAVSNLKKVKIPGFRSGKAPDYAIKTKCKKQIDSFVINEMVAQAYEDILYNAKIKPIGRPQIKRVEMPNDKKFSCEMTVFKKPDFTLSQYKELELQKPKIKELSLDKQVVLTLEDLCDRFGDIKPYDDDDIVALKDNITLDYEVFVDGNKSEELSAQGMLYSVGSDLVKGLDSNLLGMKAGEIKEFDVDNKHFKVIVHMGTKTIPAELNDELAKKLGAESVDNLKKLLSETITSRMINNEKSILRRELIEKLVNNTDINVPEWLVNMEAQHISLQEKLDWDKISEDDRGPIKSRARDNIKLSLILDSVREVEPETVLSDAEMVNVLKQRAANSGSDPEQFIVESRKNGRLLGMLAALRDEFTLQWLVDNSKLTE